MKLVLFDCDGTIADTFGLICEAMRRTFAMHGLEEPGDAATRAIIGLSLDTAILRLHPALPEDLMPSMIAGYRKNFRETRERAVYHEALFPGIKPLIESLEAREDVLLGLVTGKTRRGVKAIVEAQGLERTFLAIRTADDCPSKPHPAMVLECCSELGVDVRDTLVVGDAVYDIGMALAAGAEAIGVSWGAGTPEALLDAGALRVVADVDELRHCLDGWIEGRPVEQAGETA